MYKHPSTLDFINPSSNVRNISNVSCHLLPLKSPPYRHHFNLKGLSKFPFYLDKIVHTLCLR